MFDLDGYLAKLDRAADDLALRQRPSSYAIVLADSIHHLRAQDWDAAVGRRLFLGRSYLGAIEAAKPPRMGFRYALCYEGRTPVAAAAYQVLDIALDAFGSRQPGARPEGLRQTLRAVRNKVSDALGEGGAPRLLINGNGLVTGEHGFAIAPGVDPRAAMHGLADATYRLRRAEKLHGAIASVLIKDFPAPARPAADELLRFGYHAFEVDPNMVVAIDPAWRSFDGYLRALSAKYRRKVKDTRKRAGKLQQRRLGRAEIEHQAPRLYALYHAVHDTPGRTTSLPSPPRWATTSSCAPGRSTTCRSVAASRWRTASTSRPTWSDSTTASARTSGSTPARCISSSTMRSSVARRRCRWAAPRSRSRARSARSPNR
jgi:hypothetical protein